MNKNTLIIIVVEILFSANIFSIEYYYWYGNNEKIYLDLLPTKKYILINSTEDTTALKERLAFKNIDVTLLNVNELNSYGIKYTQKESECWALVEGKTILPNLSDDEAVLYESSFFLISNTQTITSRIEIISDKTEIILTDKLYVKLKQLDDFSVLQSLSSENNMEIYGSYQFMPLWYILSCTKNSRGNAMEMANLFYETQLFEYSHPEFMGRFYPADITGTGNPKNGKMTYVSDGVLHIHSVKGETISLYSISGSLLDIFESSDSEIQIPIHKYDDKILIVRGGSGWTEKVVNL